jgi:hypothetical protein
MLNCPQSVGARGASSGRPTAAAGRIRRGGRSGRPAELWAFARAATSLLRGPTSRRGDLIWRRCWRVRLAGVTADPNKPWSMS